MAGDSCFPIIPLSSKASSLVAKGFSCLGLFAFGCCGGAIDRVGVGVAKNEEALLGAS